MWLPSVIGLATYLLIGISPRGNKPISMLSVLTLALGILFSINAFIFSVLTFGFLAEHEECEEREFKVLANKSSTFIFFFVFMSLVML